jgi:hypothetical protein
VGDRLPAVEKLRPHGDSLARAITARAEAVAVVPEPPAAMAVAAKMDKVLRRRKRDRTGKSSAQSEDLDK